MRRPRDFRSRPMEAAVMPLPRPDATPPVTKTYFARSLTTGLDGIRKARMEHAFGSRVRHGGGFLPHGQAPETVEPAQRRHGIDDPRQRDGLRERVHDQDEPESDREPKGVEPVEERDAEREAEDVRPGVAEHPSLPEIEPDDPAAAPDHDRQQAAVPGDGECDGRDEPVL